MFFRPTMRGRHVCRPSHILKAQGGVSFHYRAKFQYLHESWFLVVFALCLSRTGVVSSALSPSFVGSELAYLLSPVNSRLISLCCSGTELDMLSSQFSVSQADGNALSACDAGAGSSIGPTSSTESSHFACSRLGLMGNR